MLFDDGFYYVYILVSETNEKAHYSITRDLMPDLWSTIKENVCTQRNAGRGESKRQSPTDPR